MRYTLLFITDKEVFPVVSCGLNKLYHIAGTMWISVITQVCLCSSFQLDCSQNTEYCTKLEVKSFPEFHFFSAGGGKRVKYIGDVKKDDVVQFIEEQSKSGVSSSTVASSYNHV